MSEDIGKPWDDPTALTDFGEREVTEPWTWAGPARSVTGPTWGGCVEVIQWILTAGRFPRNRERGGLGAIDAVLVARPPPSDLEHHLTPGQRAAHHADQRDTAIEIMAAYNPEAVVCAGPPFGHTRPQWTLPYGGAITVDGTTPTVWADYS